MPTTWTSRGPWIALRIAVLTSGKASPGSLTQTASPMRSAVTHVPMTLPARYGGTSERSIVHATPSMHTKPLTYARDAVDAFEALDVVVEQREQRGVVRRHGDVLGGAADVRVGD